jgi:hypothetical protein
VFAAVFSHSEVEAIVDDVIDLRKRVVHYRNLFFVTLGAVILISAAIFAIVICAITLTKDTYVAPGTGGTGVQTGRDGTPVRTSALKAMGVDFVDPRNRRLAEDIDGVTLVEFMTMPFDNFKTLLDAAHETGVYSATVSIKLPSVVVNVNSGGRRLAELTAVKETMSNVKLLSSATMSDGVVLHLVTDDIYSQIFSVQVEPDDNTTTYISDVIGVYNESATTHEAPLDGAH